MATHTARPKAHRRETNPTVGDIDNALAALLEVTGGEARMTAEEAKAQGYVDSRCYAAAIGLSAAAGQRHLLAAYRDGKLDRVRLAVNGMAYAYRAKRQA